MPALGGSTSVKKSFLELSRRRERNLLRQSIRSLPISISTSQDMTTLRIHCRGTDMHRAGNNSALTMTGMRRSVRSSSCSTTAKKVSAHGTSSTRCRQPCSGPLNSHPALELRTSSNRC